MRKTIIFLAVALTCSLNAMTLEEIITEALAKNNSLEAIGKKLEGAKFNTQASDNLKNPKLLVTTNSLDNNEKMSQSVVTLSQEIPYFGKLDAKEDLASSNEALLQQQLHLAKVELVKKIKQQAYTLWQLKALLRITDEYIDLTKSNIELYESYASISENQHIGIMKAELNLSELKIEHSRLKAAIKTAQEQLSYLASTKVNTLELELVVDEKPTLQSLKKMLAQNPQLQVEAKKVLIQNAKLNIADLDNYPDLGVSVGYTYRQNFENYFNVGFSLNLPIYSTEDHKEQQERAELLVQQSLQQDTKLLIDAQLGIFYAKMVRDYEIYHIVQDDALPKVAHMFELSNASVSTGGDLFKYIDVLFTKLALEKKSILAIASYHNNKASIEALTGATK
ncbi:MAG: TolC family protein [Epsilonproteobacteria bacterium]|nr:TolC family protein [Campylobacterota bacterium]